MKQVIERKVCKMCGNTFVKRKGEGNMLFSKRELCSVACRIIYAKKYKTGFHAMNIR